MTGSSSSSAISRCAAPPSMCRWTSGETPRQAAVRSSRNNPVSVRPYGGSEPNAMRSAGTRVNSDSMSIVDSHELSNTARGWSRRPSPITAWSATPT